jgi:hypothetical protein
MEHNDISVSLIDEDYEGGFGVELDMDNGYLFCMNVEVHIKGALVGVYTNYNNRDNYPLMFESPDADYRVFDEEGELTEEFISFIDSIKEGER